MPNLSEPRRVRSPMPAPGRNACACHRRGQISRAVALVSDIIAPVALISNVIALVAFGPMNEESQYKEHRAQRNPLNFGGIVGRILGVLLCTILGCKKGAWTSGAPPCWPPPFACKAWTDVFSVLAKTYGPIFRFHMGRQPMVIVADPELCKEVGIKKFKSITNRSLPSPISGSPLHQKGLFFTK